VEVLHLELKAGTAGTFKFGDSYPNLHEPSHEHEKRPACTPLFFSISNVVSVGFATSTAGAEPGFGHRGGEEDEDLKKIHLMTLVYTTSIPRLKAYIFFQKVKLCQV
jgi:hypothetical protein